MIFCTRNVDHGVNHPSLTVEMILGDMLALQTWIAQTMATQAGFPESEWKYNKPLRSLLPPLDPVDTVYSTKDLPEVRQEVKIGNLFAFI